MRRRPGLPRVAPAALCFGSTRAALL